VTIGGSRAWTLLSGDKIGVVGAQPGAANPVRAMMEFLI
jgi:hypothetical protein